MGDYMENIINLLFEAKMLKNIPRSGYHFLGTGKESVAEHSFIITFIAYVMSKMVPEVDELRLISMCLLHDLPETRIGDLNYVQKKYVTANESKAIEDITRDIPFGTSMTELIDEFNRCESIEAKLARDADQISFILDLKALSDSGNRSSGKWISHILGRLKTETGKKITEVILRTEADSWWFKDF